MYYLWKFFAQKCLRESSRRWAVIASPWQTCVPASWSASALPTIDSQTDRTLCQSETVSQSKLVSGSFVFDTRGLLERDSISRMSKVCTLLKPRACRYHSLMLLSVDFRDRSNINSSATASLHTNGNIETNSRWPNNNNNNNNFIKKSKSKYSLSLSLSPNLLDPKC